MKLQAIGNLSFGKMSKQKMKFSKGGMWKSTTCRPCLEIGRTESCSLGERVKEKITYSMSRRDCSLKLLESC